MSADRPTPEEVSSYLLANGWHLAQPAQETFPWLVFARGHYHLRVPARDDWADLRRLNEALQVVAHVERRPSPEEQVRRAIWAHAEAT